MNVMVKKDATNRDGGKDGFDGRNEDDSIDNSKINKSDNININDNK